MKLNRVFQMTVQVSDSEAVQISSPLTLNLEVSRNTLASANRGHFSIYNLKPDTRKRIFHDRYDYLTYRQVKLQAGYENESPLPVIFQGNILQAYSYRQGNNWVTEIEALDGGFGMMNGQVSQTIPAGWTLQQIIKSALGGLQNVAQGVIGNFTGENSRGVTLMGNSWSVVNQIVQPQNGNAFVDNEIVNVLKRDEYISNAAALTLITAETGLLETPRRYDGRLDVQIVFEPRLVVGQLVQLQSLETLYNGAYQVIGVQHRGTISGAVGGDLVTTANLWTGTSQLKAVA